MNPYELAIVIAFIIAIIAFFKVMTKPDPQTRAQRVELRKQARLHA